MADETPDEPTGESDADRAVTLTRLFREALNARDLDSLAAVCDDEVVFRNAQGGQSLRGHEALEALVRTAADTQLRLVRRAVEEVMTQGKTMRVVAPVIELIGKDELEGDAIFEVRAGKIEAFEVTSPQLRR